MEVQQTVVRGRSSVRGLQAGRLAGLVRRSTALRDGAPCNVGKQVQSNLDGAITLKADNLLNAIQIGDQN